MDTCIARLKNSAQCVICFFRRQPQDVVVGSLPVWAQCNPRFGAVILLACLLIVGLFEVPA